MVLVSHGSKIHPQLSPLGSLPPPLGHCSYSLFLQIVHTFDPRRHNPTSPCFEPKAFVDQDLEFQGGQESTTASNGTCFWWGAESSQRRRPDCLCICTCVWVSLLSILRLTVLMTELGRSGSGGGPASLFTGREVPQSRPAAGPSPLQSHSTART